MILDLTKWNRPVLEFSTREELEVHINRCVRLLAGTHGVYPEPLVIKSETGDTSASMLMELQP